MEELKTALEAEIVEELRLLKEVDVNSEEYSALTDGICSLTDKAIDITELENKKEDAKKERRSKVLTSVIAGAVSLATVALGLYVESSQVDKALTWEEDNIPHGQTDRGIISRIVKKH